MLKGSFVALVTPMTEARALDWGALDALVDWHLEAGTHGFVPVGTTLYFLSVLHCSVWPQ